MIFFPKSCLLRYWFPGLKCSAHTLRFESELMAAWSFMETLLPKKIILGPKMVLSLCLASRDFHQNRKEQQGRGICFDLGCQSKKRKPKETFPCARGVAKVAMRWHDVTPKIWAEAWFHSVRSYQGWKKWKFGQKVCESQILFEFLGFSKSTKT